MIRSFSRAASPRSQRTSSALQPWERVRSAMVERSWRAHGDESRRLNCCLSSLSSVHLWESQSESVSVWSCREHDDSRPGHVAGEGLETSMCRRKGPGMPRDACLVLANAGKRNACTCYICEMDNMQDVRLVYYCKLAQSSTGRYLLLSKPL